MTYFEPGSPDDRVETLVSLNPETNQLEFDHAVLSQRLSQVDEPVGVFVLCSPNEFLLNLLSERTQVASTILRSDPKVSENFCGLRLWGPPRTLRHVLASKRMPVYFVDVCQGGDPDQTIVDQLYALAFMLSSMFSFHSIHTIDAPAIDELSRIVDLSRRIQPSNESTTNIVSLRNQFQQIAPEFLWIVSSFRSQDLAKVAGGGRVVSDQEYLDAAIQPSIGQTESSRKLLTRQASLVRQSSMLSTTETLEPHSSLRNHLDTFFSKRDCSTLMPPTKVPGEDNALHVPWIDLQPVFQNQVAVLRKKLFTSFKPKTLYNHKLTGRSLAGFAVHFLDQMNRTGDATAPSAASCWGLVLDQGFDDAVAAGLAKFDSLLALQDVAENREDATLKDADELVGILEKLTDEAMTKFLELAKSIPGDATPHASALRAKMKDHGDRWLSEHNASSREYCVRLVWELFGHERIQMQRNGFFETKGDFVSEQMDLWIQAVQLAMDEYERRAVGADKYTILFAWLFSRQDFPHANPASGDGQQLLPSMINILSTWIQTASVGVRESVGNLKAKVSTLEDENRAKDAEKMQAVHALEAARKEHQEATRAPPPFPPPSSSAMLAALANIQTDLSSIQQQIKSTQRLDAGSHEKVLQKLAKLHEDLLLKKDHVSSNNNNNRPDAQTSSMNSDIVAHKLACQSDKLDEMLSWINRQRTTQDDEVERVQRERDQARSENEDLRRRLAEAEQTSRMAVAAKEHVVEELSLVRESFRITTEHLDNTQEKLTKKTNELRECEFQWAQCKVELLDLKSEQEKLDFQSRQQSKRNLHGDK